MEKWLPVPDWEDLYEVSDLGQVRSLPRQTRSGIRGGKILKRTLGHNGYLLVQLSAEGKVTGRLVHRLVLLAFVGEPEPGQEARHLDGDRTNTSLINLRWGTSSENEWDKIRHGTHQQASKTSCINGHELTEDNVELSYYPDGKVRQRHCKECRKTYRQVGKERRLTNPVDCERDQCKDPVVARKLCSRHYQEERRNQPGFKEIARGYRQTYNSKKSTSDPQ